MPPIFLILAAAYAAVVHAVPRIVDFRAATASQLPCDSGVIVAAPVCPGEGTCDLPKNITVDWVRGSAPVTLDLDNSAAWRIGLDAKQCWSPEIVFGAGDTAGPRSAPVWPVATIQAKLIVEKGLKLPAKASIAIDNGEVSCACSMLHAADGLTSAAVRS